MTAHRAAFFIAFVAAATLAACGGKTSDIGGAGPGDGGSSGSSGASSGGSTSGGASSGGGSNGGSTGGSSGGSSNGGSTGGSSGGSSSGASSGGSSASSSGGSTSSSGGGGCPAQPGEGTCYPNDQCTYGSGCNATHCSCDAQGGWICTTALCPPPECPPGASPGAACNYQGQTCGYPSNGGGCGLECTCDDIGGALEWSCVAPPCPPPICPPTEPTPGTACSFPGANSVCEYLADGGVCAVNCACDPSGAWSCSPGLCKDAGAHD